jgi:hypothetical protein
MHPDHAAWSAAPDRYETVAWYRELGAAAAPSIAARPPAEHPLARGMAALERHFGVRPTTLIPPGDQWTNEALIHALDLRLQLVSSYYLAVRDGDRLWWGQHVCAPYLDEPRPEWVDAGLPVIGYYHDRDLALEGVEWMSRALDRWATAGARRFLDLRELAAAIGRRLALEDRDGQPALTVTAEGAAALVRPVGVLVRVPGGRSLASLPVRLGGTDLTLPVEPLDGETGRVELPPLAGVPPARSASRE